MDTDTTINTELTMSKYKVLYLPPAVVYKTKNNINDDAPLWKRLGTGIYVVFRSTVDTTYLRTTNYVECVSLYHTMPILTIFGVGCMQDELYTDSYDYIKPNIYRYHASHISLIQNIMTPSEWCIKNT